MEDAYRRDKAGDVRIRPSFGSEHVTNADLTSPNSIDKCRRGQWNEQPASFGQSIEPGRQDLGGSRFDEDGIKASIRWSRAGARSSYTPSHHAKVGAFII